MTTNFKMKELMDQFQISEDTLRYYEKMGLLPPVARKNNGHRIYNNSYKEALLMIKCLKKSRNVAEGVKTYYPASIR